jgi:hypothetical protein
MSDFLDWKGQIEAALEVDLKRSVSPAHYSSLKPEPLEVIEGWGLPFHEAQVLKYIARAGLKGGSEKILEDLHKARFYLDRRIALLTKKRDYLKTLAAPGASPL